MARVARLPTIDRAEDAERRRVPRLRTRYYAFLSYSHKDKELADWLHRELEKFRVPHALAGKLTANGVVPRRLTPIFRDHQDLSAGGGAAPGGKTPPPPSPLPLFFFFSPPAQP